MENQKFDENRYIESLDPVEREEYLYFKNFKELAEIDKLTNAEFNQVCDDLTLALMYLLKFKKNHQNEPYFSAWKGYDFDSLNRLEDKNLIYSGKFRSNKSIYFNKESFEKARSILKEIIGCLNLNKK